MPKKVMYVIPKEDGTSNITVHGKILDDASLDELLEILKPIFRFQEILFSYESLEKNFSELIEVVEFYSKDIAEDQFGMPSTANGIRALSRLNRVIHNYLGTTNSFLAITEVVAKNFFGKDSPEFQGWNKLRKDLHSQNLSYRFIYELRNYSQHYGLPFSKLNFKKEKMETAEPIKFFQVLMERDTLLNKGFNWGNIRKDIESLDKEFELIHHLDSCNEIIKEIYKGVVLAFKQYILLAKIQIDRFINEFDIPEGVEPIIINDRTPGDEPIFKESFLIPLHNLNWIMQKCGKIMECDELLALIKNTSEHQNSSPK